MEQKESYTRLKTSMTSRLRRSYQDIELHQMHLEQLVPGRHKSIKKLLTIHHIK